MKMGCYLSKNVLFSDIENNVTDPKKEESNNMESSKSIDIKTDDIISTKSIDVKTDDILFNNVKQSIAFTKTPIDLNSVDISTVKIFSFDGIITDCKVINIKDADTIKVIMNINNNVNIYNIRMYGYDAPSTKSKSSKSSRKDSTTGLRARLFLANLITSCDSKLTEKMRSKEINKIIIKENNKIVKIHLMHFDKYDEIYARIYLDEHKKFVDELMIENNLVYPFEQVNDSN
jgi:endonuclease YncB( thermonuclease family)